MEQIPKGVLLRADRLGELKCFFSVRPGRGRVAEKLKWRDAEELSGCERPIILNAKQANRLNCYVATLGVLQSEKYKSVWSSKVALSKAVTDLEDVVSQISDCAQVQESRDGAAAEKAQTLQELGDAAFEVAAAVKSCASASGNKYLAGQVDFSRSEITKGRDSSVLARCRAIHAAASDVLSSLADYEVTAAKLTALKKKIDAFDAAQSKPRQATTSGSAATKDLTRLFRQAAEILTERLDGLLVPFKATEPTFYNEYQSARVVVDAAGGRASRESNVVSAPNPTAKAA